MVLSDSECTKIRGLIGMARRAGDVRSGLRATLDAVRAGRCRLILIAADASPRTKRHVNDASQAITIFEVPSSKELGIWIGSSPVAVLSVTNTNFAKGVVRTISKLHNQGSESTASRRTVRRRR